MSKNLSASILARLLTLAKQRGDDYSLLLNRFALERLLLRVSTSPHADRFLLKGALLFALWYDTPHRPTRDADLLGFGQDDEANLIATFCEVAAMDLGDGIAFDPESVRAETIREDTSASWLNQVEIWFGIFQRKTLNNASFQSTEHLVAAIHAFTAAYNENATPFVWRKREVRGAQLRNTIVNLRN